MHQEDFVTPHEEWTGGHTPLGNVLKELEEKGQGADEVRTGPAETIEEPVSATTPEPVHSSKFTAPENPATVPSREPSPQHAAAQATVNREPFEDRPDQTHPSGNPQIIFSWKAPLRPFVKRSQKIVRFYLALALLLSLIILFFGDWILLIPIWTVLFLFYVLTITPPPEVEHKIMQFGIDTTGTKLRWEALLNFHFDKRFGYEILTLVTQPPYFDHFYMVVPTQEIRRCLMVILSSHIVYEDDPHKTFVDKMVAWFSKLVPQENEEQAIQS